MLSREGNCFYPYQRDCFPDTVSSVVEKEYSALFNELHDTPEECGDTGQLVHQTGFLAAPETN
jgi:hypothetical protein